ncbi:MAG: DtxR family transcriptional regulator [Longimicrobiales bacterium]
MVNPAFALAVFATLVAAALLLFWPSQGVLARVRRLMRVSERVRSEDVLKALYKLEYERIPATADGVAGGAQMSRQHTARVLQRLEELDFVEAEGLAFRLSETGRSYALRIIRTHRLWERFLADRTGTRPEEWHELAEAREHVMSQTATEDLASSLGHPIYDPHGDPIPTAQGEMPAQSGFPLLSLRVGEKALITHLEDEPPEFYAQLVALGLGPLVPIERLEAPKGKVGFRAGAHEGEMETSLARNVTVELDPSAANERWNASLADLELGEAAEVLGIAPTCQGPARRRLLDLGLVPGTTVTAQMRSASGDPVAYEIRGALIALRQDQAELIQIARAESAVEALAQEATA